MTTHTQQGLAPRAVSTLTRAASALELIVLVTTLGLLGGYVVPRYHDRIDRTAQMAAEVQLAAFTEALDAYRADTGHYPPTDVGLEGLVKQPDNEPDWKGPYLANGLPLDPWGNPYLYRSPGVNGAYDLVSYDNGRALTVPAHGFVAGS